ncbi:Drug/metabolite transporter [Macleaya cordata]|uniref:WAT1-related protein n=1 Tax=Macleaya cordata TaxID=56857 RepID=A0A200RB56_MACCD|nr:Drug/metabolite transporter [Macleaya cordata]
MNPCKAFIVAINNQKACLAMVFIQLTYAGMVMLSKVALKDGMSPLVFVAYRQTIAVIVLAPFAFALEREKVPLSFYNFCKIFLLALCGLTLSMDLYYFSLRFTSATFASTILSLIPVVTFILSIFLRMESVDCSTIYGQCKIGGVVLSVGGTLVLSLYRGPALKFFNYRGTSLIHHIEEQNRNRFIEGPVLMFISVIAWSIWLILQAEMIKIYPNKLRFTTLQGSLSAVQSFITAVAFDRKLSSWRLGWDIQLLSLVYCGVFVTGISYGLQIWCVDKKGPFYVAMFSPLSLFVTAIFSGFVLAELLYTGRFILCNMGKKEGNKSSQDKY